MFRKTLSAFVFTLVVITFSQSNVQAQVYSCCLNPPGPECEDLTVEECHARGGHPDEEYVCAQGACNNCGDGFLDTLWGEQCDDGNTDDTDGCHNDCTFNINRACCLPDGTCFVGTEVECEDLWGQVMPKGTVCEDVECGFCGDGIVQPALGEECDDGNDVDDDECNNNCMLNLLECRVTGGGVDSFDEWDGSMGSGKHDTDRYTFGGQAGAPTASQPQPFGEWTHHQQRGPSGRFVFHMGTASSPTWTEVDLITCSDPGYCVQARPAPAKQIDFEGIGSFKNITRPSAATAGAVPGVTMHWCEVHIEDLGEPGKSGKQDPPASMCPPQGSAGMLADCACPDYYSITIYAGPDSSSGVLYHIEGYITGGNLQIHPPIK